MCPPVGLVSLFALRLGPTEGFSWVIVVVAQGRRMSAELVPSDIRVPTVHSPAACTVALHPALTDSSCLPLPVALLHNLRRGPHEREFGLCNTGKKNIL